MLTKMESHQEKNKLPKQLMQGIELRIQQPHQQQRGFFLSLMHT